jgi:hypothetical protein
VAAGSVKLVATNANRATEIPMRLLIVGCLAAAVQLVAPAPSAFAQLDQPKQKQTSQVRPRGGMSEQQLLRNPLVQQILRDPELQQQIMDDPRFQDLVHDPQMQRLMQNPQVQRQLQQNQQLREMYQLQRRPLPGVGEDDD